MRDKNEEFRYGSARWAEADEIAHAGLFRETGLPFGYFENRLMRLQSDAPRICVAGAGGGKLRDLLGFVLCLPCSMPMAVLDPRGELWSVSMPTLAAQNIYGYCWAPFSRDGIAHSINPLDHLTPDSPTLFAEIIRLVRALIPLSHSSNGKYFELTAQNILATLIYHEVLKRGSVSFPRVHELIHIVEGDTDAWANQLESMLSSSEDFIRSAASAMLTRQQDAPKEFAAVMGEIYAYMVWLNDANIRNALTGGDASLQELVKPSLNGGHKVRFHFNVPADLIEFCSPILRVFFDTIIALKARHQDADSVLLLVDEAATLGHFEALQSAFTYGRGAGLVTWAFFQDLGQIEAKFGRAGIQTFLGSAAHRQFFGVRDITTANVVSSMAGIQTLEFDDEGAQAAAHYQIMEGVQSILDGADPVQISQSLSHHGENARRRSKMRRPLITPDEVLNMADDEAISFISGKNIRPIFHNKYPYYERLKAGQFYPNPNHPPIDRIQVKGLWGKKYLPVRRVSVPSNLRHFPQYQNGVMLVVDH